MGRVTFRISFLDRGDILLEDYLFYPLGNMKSLPSLEHLADQVKVLWARDRIRDELFEMADVSTKLTDETMDGVGFALLSQLLSEPDSAFPVKFEYE